ncbi:NaeI family type II restriction endonuclease, partial [Streptococcus suis]
MLAPIALAIVSHGGGENAFAIEVPQLFRRAIDEVIDSPRTNRFTLKETEKTEKTYLGTKIEILLRDHLKLGKGKNLDLSINGYDVD